ncbi:hypothetical protein GCM10025789_12260 [Tessaracoccus lubricantis]|uniref:Alpha/beta hydrolase n=1 Tax=Tessaracoccus lubricantis TaxID=545543 RepID=A0ABP9FB88_9ACTN
MDWNDGLSVNPGALQARAGQLRRVKGQLDGQLEAHASIDVGPWSGEAHRAQEALHRRLVSSLESQARRLPPAADALEGAARSFREIQSAQHSLIGRASAWSYGIGGSGWLRDQATGWTQLDPRRPFMRARFQTSAFGLLTRLNLADVALAGSLGANEFVNDGRDLLDAGAEWLDGRISEGLDWGADLIEDAEAWGREVAADVQSRLEHADTAWDRFVETAGSTPAWLRDLHDKGEIPQLSEVLGQVTFLGGQLAGVPTNFLTDSDQHLFDDGRPYLAGPADIERHETDAFDGINSLIDPMMDVYNTHDPQDHTDRARVQVTAVEDPTTGEVRYVVSIPGTTEGMGSVNGWAGNPTGTDWAANLRGVGYGDTAATRSIMHSVELAIAEDMAARGTALDGTRPEVLLTGHSQGGIIAGNIARDPGFSERFDVGGVVSAGSPVDTLGIPQDVPVYNYQNRWDPVPRVDLGGVPTGTPPNVTNIVFPHEGSPSPTHTHLQQTYQDNIRELSYGVGLPENLSKQAQLDAELARFYNGDTTAYRVTFGRETD